MLRPVGLLLALAFGSAGLVLSAEPARATGEASWAARAEELLRRAELTRDPDDRFALADQAQALAERAMQVQPADPMPHLVAATALGLADPQKPETCRPRACERAARELVRARELDAPGMYGERIASELGILYSRLGAYANALAEYDRALRSVATRRIGTFVDRPPDRAVLYGNSAETLMAMGRLDEAIARYRRAEKEAAANPTSEALELAEWGLGVALDRDEQPGLAEQAILQALARDPAMRMLSADHVFFEPPGDKAYYLALGYEVSGMRPRALAAWRAYLRAQPDARWAPRARAHIVALERARGAFVDPDRAQVFIERISARRPVGGDLDRVLDDNLDDLKVCAAEVQAHAPELRGGVTLSFTVGLLGGVHEAHAEAAKGISAPVREPLERCVAAAALQWQFPVVDELGAGAYTVEIAIGPLR